MRSETERSNHRDASDASELSTYSYDPQSGMEGTAPGATIMKMSGDTTHQNVSFGDQFDPYMTNVESSMDPTRKLMDSSDAELGNFLMRPLKIYEEEWGTNAPFYFAIDPWGLYLENSRVINRITNFNLLRSILRIKIVINGNGFLYGRAIASYLPLKPWDSLSLNRSLVSSDLVQASQLPHIFLDPTTSMGGEMALPYFDYRNNLNIPSSDWQEMGELVVRSINPLRHANGASDQVTVSVFAWVEQVSMSVLTSVDTSTLSPQSGNEVDEANAKGVISGPATTVAKVASALSVVPQIAPFAKATAAGASIVAGVAKSLGYSRPPVTKNPEPYRAHPTSSLALTTVPDGAQKMTVDDKQELSIDPRIAGIGPQDPLNIRGIAMRESYLTTFTWNIGTPPETLLWNSRIDPCTWNQDTFNPPGYHFPACAMAAMPFKYWTGKMKFRFQIVCSTFHKGRLKIVYDPNFLAGSEYNTNYLEIVDIADKTDFTIEIGNGQNTTLLSHALPGEDSVTQLYSTTPYAAVGPGNGVVGVYVVNELTTPNSTVTNDIEVNVFVSMGDDFEVFVPDDHFQRFVFRPQSGMEINAESQATEEPSAPEQKLSSSLGPGDTNHHLVNQVFIGEAISNFRPLLKRYNLHHVLTWGQTTGDRFHSGTRPMFPYLRGNVADAVDTTAADAAYNFCNTVLLHWVTYAFSGWRGSMRWKILPRGQIDVNNKPAYYIERVPQGQFEYGADNEPALTFPTLSAARSNVVKTDVFGNLDSPTLGVRGQIYGHGQINPTVEFEVPFYSPFRFNPGKTQSHTLLGVFTDSWKYRIYTAGNNATCYDAHCAAGEDFQVYFFTGLPVMYYELFPPNPALV